MDMQQARRLLDQYGWTEWLCHSNYSFLMGASYPEEYVDRAQDLGYRALALTDLDGAYGLARAHGHWQRLRQRSGAAHGGAAHGGADHGEAQGRPVRGAVPRLIHGAEIHLGVDHHRPMIFRDTLVLLAQTKAGYRHLCRLLTYAHRDGKSQATVSLDDLLAHDTEDLVVLQPMRGLVRYGDRDQVLQRYRRLAQHFKGRFYLAISRHWHPSEDYWIQTTLDLARALSLPCLLTQDAFFHAPERKPLSDLLQAIRTNQTLDQAVGHMFVNSERSLHPLEGIAARFGALQCFAEALRIGQELESSFAFDMSELRYRYPQEMIPAGYTAQSFLEELTWRAARERYQPQLPERMVRLLRHELALIETLSFADYFLTVWDIVRWARSRGILCQGRGSAANSAVCFVLGITAVDPATFDLLFERFVSVERGDPPDIDVDFEHERREEVIQYIYQRYGRHRAAMVANVITFRTKGAMRAVGKALGVPEAALARVARHLEEEDFRHYVARQSQTVVAPRDAASAEETLAPGGSRGERSESLAEASIPWDLWRDLADQIKGFPRHLGIHSGGFILADEALEALVPVEPATMPGRSVIQWSKDDIEGLGFFKIDILALGMLTAVRKTMDAVGQYYGTALTLDRIPQEDPATYRMIQRADTVGTFQIESRAQMSMLPRLRPRTFYDLVVEVAIIRPGPIQGGMVHPYLRRREGVEPVTFPDERLRPILTRTLGIPLFQEQVMRIAMAVGGFSPGEANELRRHMGAWSIKGHMGPWLERLANGMRQNGLQEDFVQGILGQMRGFAHYGFPESHAVSFALIAYASAWLKCHYPAPFFMALLNSQPMGFYAPYALVQAAQRSGVRILPVCVNRSSWDAVLEQDEGSKGGQGYAIRLGFRLVTGLRHTVGQEIAARRQAAGGSFRDLYHLTTAAMLHRPDITALAAADALRCFGLERKAALWCAEAAPFCATLEDPEDVLQALPREDTMERIRRDLEATAVTLGPHPTEVIRRELWCYPVPQARVLPARELARVEPGRSVYVFGMVLVRQSPPSAKGMVFLTMEDGTGFINLVMTPEIYTRYSALVESQAFLCVRGRMQRQAEAHSIMVLECCKPRLERADVIPIAAKGPQRQMATPTLVASGVR